MRALVLLTLLLPRDLAERLRDPQARNRQDAANDVGQLYAREHIPTLRILLHDREGIVRVAALRALEKLEAREAIPDFIALLGGQDLQLKEDASRALAHLGVTEAVPAIVKLLKDPHGRCRSAAAYSLARLDTREAIPDVARLLKDSLYDVRADTTSALAEFGTRDRIPEIAALLRDRHPWVRGSAAVALAKLDARERTPEIVRLLELETITQAEHDPEKNFEARQLACSALAMLGAKEHVSRLARMLKDPSWYVRCSAAHALALLGAGDRTAEIATLLADPHEQVRESALHALGDLGAKERAADIARFLKATEPSIRRAALRALERFGVADRKAEFIACLSDEAIRTPAAEALCRAGFREGAPALVKFGGKYSLNALRARHLWSRLGDQKTDLALKGTRRNLAERLAVTAGLNVEFSSGIAKDPVWLERTIIHCRLPKPLSVEQGLLSAVGDRCELILEADRVRVLLPDEAAAFWRAWWNGAK